MRLAAPSSVRISVRLALALIIATTATASAGPPRDLMQPRCYVSAREDAIACPSYTDVRQPGADASWFWMGVWFADDRMFETHIAHVGKDYGGTISFAPPISTSELRRRLAKGRFVPGPRARETKIDQWIPTRPRSHLVWRDEVQLDAVLEVDCGNGRLVQDGLTVTGQRYFFQVMRGRVALLGRSDSETTGIRVTEVGYRIADPAALCAAPP